MIPMWYFTVIIFGSPFLNKILSTQLEWTDLNKNFLGWYYAPLNKNKMKYEVILYGSYMTIWCVYLLLNIYQLILSYNYTAYFFNNTFHIIQIIIAIRSLKMKGYFEIDQESNFKMQSFKYEI